MGEGFLLNNGPDLVQVGRPAEREFHEHTDFFVRDGAVDDDLVADDRVGNDHTPVFEVLDNGMTQGNILHISRIKRSDAHAVAYAERFENNKEQSANNV